MRFVTILLSSVLLAGCTVIPKWGAPKVASWDGNAQNSGLIAQLPDHSAIITARANARYMALATDYGWKFNPHIDGTEAVPYTNSTTVYTYRLDAEHLADFAIMSRWKHQGVK